MEVVFQRYTIESICQPPERFFQSTASKSVNMDASSTGPFYIKSIEPVPPGERGRGVYSILFMVSKKERRLEDDPGLPVLNKFIWLRHFRMETLRAAVVSLPLNEFLKSLDLTVKYLHVLTHSAHKRFLHSYIYSHISSIAHSPSVSLRRPDYSLS